MARVAGIRPLVRSVPDAPAHPGTVVVARLDEPITLAAYRDGALVDALYPDDEGPFSVARCGGLPTGQVGRLVTSGQIPDAAAARRFLLTEGGARAYLDDPALADLAQLAERAASDAHAAEVLAAIAYQTAKAIGALAAALGVRPDAVELAGLPALTDQITARIAWIAPVRLGGLA